MNENNSNNIVGTIIIILLIAALCIGIIYYYRGAGGKLESELDNLENLNSAIASEARQLQTGLASHNVRITTVSDRIAVSKKRVADIYTDIGQAASATERTIEVIEECEDIIEAVKTQR